MVLIKTDLYVMESDRYLNKFVIKSIKTSSIQSASDDKKSRVKQETDRESQLVFRSYEEELENILENDPSPTESELIQDLENEFGDDDLIEKYKRERKCFLERSASFNSNPNGQPGAFVRYPNQLKPKRSSSFCSGTSSRSNATTGRSDRSLERKQGGSDIKKPKRLARCKSFEGQIDTSESEDYVEVRRKKFNESKKREKRKSRKEKRVEEETKTIENEVIVNKSSLSVRRFSEISVTKEVKTEDNVPKPIARNKPAPPPVPVRRSFPSKEEKHKTEIVIPIGEKKEEKKEKSELKIVEVPQKKIVDNSGTHKGALQCLYEEGLKKIKQKRNSESEGEEKTQSESEGGNPFKEKPLSPLNYVAKRPQTLKIKVGFESPAIGQDLNTPPALADTEEKTLPYYLKSQESGVSDKSKEKKIEKPKLTDRCENNIEYEKYVELGKNLIKVSSPFDKKKEKVLEEAEVERRIIEDEIDHIERKRDSRNSPKKSLKKLEIKKAKEAKPDYSNEIREEVEPITPDTDQSEIEEILETFSKELKNSDVNEILSGDESRFKKRSSSTSSTPKTFLETAFLSSPPIGKYDSMPQYDHVPLRKTVSSPRTVSKTRDQVLMTSILRKEGRPNTLPLNNNGMPDTSLTLENYIERKRSQYPPSGRVSAPLFKESYHSPGYASGRRSVPVDHQRNEIQERGRSLQRVTLHPVQAIYDDNDNFKRNNLRTRSLTRDGIRGYTEAKMMTNDIIYESRIPKSVNNNVGRMSLDHKNPAEYTASEIEAVFWERLKQKKLRAQQREQELLQLKLPNNFNRNTPERSTIGPIFQREMNHIQNGRSQSALDFVKEPVETPTTPSSDTERKKEKGFSITKIPFFRKRSKSGSKEDSYKRASEDYEDTATSPIFKRGSLISTSSNEGTDSSTTNLHKKVSFDQTDSTTWPTRNGPALIPPTRLRPIEKHLSSDSDVFVPNKPEVPSRPLPPLPKESGEVAGYGVILRGNKVQKGKDQQSPQTPKSPEYGRIVVAEAQRASPLYDVARNQRNMGIIHENELYGNTRFRERELYVNRRSGIKPTTHSDTESGSEAGEVQRILHGVDNKRQLTDEEWGADGKGRGGAPCSDPVGPPTTRDDDVRRLGRPGNRRDDPRRHTLSGGHHQSASIARSMDLEMSSKTQRRKSPLPRGYPPPSSAMLYDDDPGIMSEAETSSTGFRRGGKQRSSLPVVRTPSKTLERPLGSKTMSGAPSRKPMMLMVNQPPESLIGSGGPTTHGGLVFLQYRSETKRALLPNEITSIDTVKALFVRSFPKQLTMEYLDSPMVKIYIHDSNKDMFYELEDLRSHLRDIRDRSVLRLFEAADVNGGAGGAVPGGPGLLGPPSWDQDQSYFSEPEFDSEYQHQHIHKSKSSKSAPQSYYMTHSYPPGQGPPASASATLPRGGSLLRTYSPAVAPVLPADRMKAITPSGPPSRRYPPRYPEPYGRYSSEERLHSESGYMSSPERGGTRGYPAYVPPGGGSYEDPYYSGGYGSRTGSITPVIDEEASDTEVMDDSYHIYGVSVRGSAPVARATTPRRDFPAPGVPFDATRLRVEHMERQLANLTGLVQKALTQTPVVTPREYLTVPAPRDAYRTPADDYDKHSSSSSASLPDETYIRSDVKPPKLGKDKSVSFEKSVSFSDEPPDMNSPKQHSPQHSADTKPAKPAIKSSTLPRTSSQERDRHKPPPPPKPVSLSPGQYDNRLVDNRLVYRDLQLTPEMYNQLRTLQKKAKDLRQEMRNLRRMSQAQAHTIREAIRDTFIKIRAMLLAGGETSWAIEGDKDRLRLSREEDLYKQEMIRLEKDLTELESTVEELRGNVINRKTRVNMSDVEDMALILSKSSKTVADLKVRFPGLQEGIKGLLSSEMDRVVREEKFLKEEPERLENALRRCKKLTGTLVTLKRLASVQEQRLPPTGEQRLSPTPADTPPATPPALAHTKPSSGVPASSVMAPAGRDDAANNQRPENALDALLDELQTFARPPGPPQSPNSSRPPSMSEIGRRKGSIDSNNPPLSSTLPLGSSSLRRLHSYPSSSDDSSPPVQTRDSQKPATGPKPPVPERNAELLSQLANRRVPPPPPPRTSSRSPLASPTSPSLPPRSINPPSQPQMGINTGTLRRSAPGRSSLREPLKAVERRASAEDGPTSAQTSLGVPSLIASASNSSSCESVNSQEGVKSKESRKEQLEQRHQELLRKQKALQEQYARLQQLQRGTTSLAIPTHDLILKKTGSESNLLAKMGLGQNLTAAAPMSGSLTHLAPQNQAPLAPLTTPANPPTSTTKVYETDIL